MRKTNIFIILLLLSISEIAYSQTVIDFSTIAFNPNFFDNGGCKTYNRFGPNPISVNGHNVRTVGSSLWTWSQPKSLSLYAFSNMETSPRENVVISVEYPFQANKTYKIEINGINDHSWNNWIVPQNHYNGVFWVKLENNPEISTTVSNPCAGSYTSVEKKVDRYSKLIADRRVAFEDKNYSVKFSTLENKNALKITFDSSPNDPNIVIDNIFRLKNIKITEMPYEEYRWEDARYSNVPRPAFGGPEYSVYNPRPDNAPAPNIPDFSIRPEQWQLISDGKSYSLNLKTLIPNVDFNLIKELQVLPPGGRRGPAAPITLPVLGWKDIDLTYRYDSNGNIILSYRNLKTTPFVETLNFRLIYR